MEYKLELPNGTIIMKGKELITGPILCNGPDFVYDILYKKEDIQNIWEASS